MRLFDSIRDLVCSWYAADRIRIAPTTGRLLKIQAGDSIILLNDLYVVTRRQVTSMAEGHTVVLQLNNDGSQTELHVASTHPGQKTTGTLMLPDRMIDVFDDDVAILESCINRGGNRKQNR